MCLKVSVLTHRFDGNPDEWEDHHAGRKPLFYFTVHCGHEAHATHRDDGVFLTSHHPSMIRDRKTLFLEYMGEAFVPDYILQETELAGGDGPFALEAPRKATIHTFQDMLRAHWRDGYSYYALHQELREINDSLRLTNFLNCLNSEVRALRSRKVEVEDQLQVYRDALEAIDGDIRDQLLLQVGKRSELVESSSKREEDL